MGKIQGFLSLSVKTSDRNLRLQRSPRSHPVTDTEWGHPGGSTAFSHHEHYWSQMEEVAGMAGGRGQTSDQPITNLFSGD